MSQDVATYCRNCEALCGLVVTVEHGRVVGLRGDLDHPVSRGYACAKGVAMREVQYDADRVRLPLERMPSGGFAPVSWEHALNRIAEKVSALLGRYGPESIAWYLGNPGAFSHTHVPAVYSFMRALGSHQLYSSISQDGGSRFAASSLLYGSPTVFPIPDLDQTRFLVVIGANPFVSNGSLVVAPRIRQRLRAIVERGGRVVVIDPRRTETARQFEHIPIRPSSDAWLLLSLLYVVFEEGLGDEAFVAASTKNVERLSKLVRRFSPEATETQTGVAGSVVRDLARDFAYGGPGVVYGRTGTCTSSSGTLVAFLIDALNVVTGNLDRPGGGVFGWTPRPFGWAAKVLGLSSYNTGRSGGFPEVMGFRPAGLLTEAMAGHADAPVRALFVSAGNPVLSIPDGEGLRRRLPDLDLVVALDLYVNETSAHADYILPSTTWLERDDVPITFTPLMLTPVLQWANAAVAPEGEAREESAVIFDLLRRLSSVAGPIRRLRIGTVRALFGGSARRRFDWLLRAGDLGDRFGLRRGGLSVAALARRPHGVVLAPRLPTGVLTSRLGAWRRFVDLAPPEIVQEILALQPEPSPEGFPLMLVGRRESRSMNSWMHNVPSLRRGSPTQQLYVHPVDAAAAGAADGECVRVTSARGSVCVEMSVTADMMPGTASLPHGWGHSGGWHLANAAGGANANALTEAGPRHLERLAGMARLNGVPIRIERCDTLNSAGQARRSDG